MSGGSYDYLCFKDSSDILNHLETVERMANDLTVEGFPLPAFMTRKVVLLARSYQARMDKLLGTLQDVWQAQEWYASCDYSLEQVKDAVKKFEALE